MPIGQHAQADADQDRYGHCRSGDVDVLDRMVQDVDPVFGKILA
jgi:hypothetical protein